MEQHVSVCCYRCCGRCGEEVYAKVYAYHLGGCRGERQIKRVKSIDAFAAAKPMVLPCSLVFL
jgi:hypothetical protein